MRYRFSKNDISCSRNDCGNLVLSVMLDGRRVSKTYVFYPKREAIRKFQEEFGTYPKNYKPIGTLCLCNHGGLAVMDIEYGIEDYVHVTDNYGDGYKNLTKNKIHYNAKGDGYFVRNGRRWYLKEFM